MTNILAHTMWSRCQLFSTLPRSTRLISSSPRPGWTPACATTAAAPGCRLLPSTGNACGCCGFLAVNVTSPVTGYCGVLGPGLAEEAMRVVPLLLHSQAFSPLSWEEAVINGTNWLMCFASCTVFPRLLSFPFFLVFFLVIILLRGSRAAVCVNLTKLENPNRPSLSFRTTQQHGWPDLAAWHYIQEFQERRLPLDHNAQPAAAHQEQWDGALHAEVRGKWFSELNVFLTKFRSKGKKEKGKEKIIRLCWNPYFQGGKQ